MSESGKSFCLASISVRYEVPTQFWNLPPIIGHFIGGGKFAPPGKIKFRNRPGIIGLIYCSKFIFRIIPLVTIIPMGFTADEAVDQQIIIVSNKK